MNDLKLKKQSHEFLPDGKLKVWVAVEETTAEERKEKQKIGDFIIIVDDTISREDLDKTIKAEYEKLKKQQERVKELGIGEEVK